MKGIILAHEEAKAYINLDTIKLSNALSLAKQKSKDGQLEEAHNKLS